MQEETSKKVEKGLRWFVSIALVFVTGLAAKLVSDHSKSSAPEVVQIASKGSETNEVPDAKVIGQALQTSAHKQKDNFIVLQDGRKFHQVDDKTFEDAKPGPFSVEITHDKDGKWTLKEADKAIQAGRSK